MNKIFKVIWCKASQTWIAVSELSKVKSISTATNGEKITDTSPNKMKTALAAMSLFLITYGAHAHVQIGYTANDRISSDGASASGPLNTFPFSYYNPGNKSYDDRNTAMNEPDYFNRNYAGAIAIGNQAKGIGTNSSSGIAIGDYSQATSSLTVSMGAFSRAESTGAMAFGTSSRAAGFNSLAMMRQSAAIGKYSAAIGSAAWADGESSFALGASATAKGNQSIAIGSIKPNTISAGTTEPRTKYDGMNNTQTNGDRSMALGTAAKTNGDDSFALGYNAQTGEFEQKYDSYLKEDILSAPANKMASKAIAIGSNAKAQKESAMAFGYDASSIGTNAIAIGTNATARFGDVIAIGKDANATKQGALAIGKGARANANNSLALGTNTIVDSVDGGASRYTNQIYNVENGVVAIANQGAERRIVNVAGGKNDTDAVNVAQLKIVNDNLAKSIGGNGYNGYESNGYTYKPPVFDIKNSTYSNVKAAVEAAQTNYVSVNSTNKTAGSNYDNKGAQAVGSIALGEATKTGNSATNSIAVGLNTNVTGSNSIALGAGLTVATSGSVVLGEGSSTDGSHNTETVTNATVDGQTYSGFAGKPTDAGKFVSIGAKGKERQLKNVAAGHVAADSTDAINGSQLFSVAKRVEQGWDISSGNENGGTTSGSATKTIKPGSAVKLLAGKNLDVKQNENNFTFSTQENVSFTNVTTQDLTATGNTTVNNLTVKSGGVVNMGNNRVTGVATPIQNTDAANKKYVDDLKFTYTADNSTQGENLFSTTTNFAGTANEIVTKAENGKVSFKLADQVKTSLSKADSAMQDLTIGADSANAAQGITLNKTNKRVDIVGMNDIATKVNGKNIEVDLAKATKDKIQKHGEDINTNKQNIANNAGKIATNSQNIANNKAEIDKGFGLLAQDSQNVTKQLGEKVEIVGGNTNINTSVANNRININLNNNLDLGTTGSVTIGDTVLNNKGLTIANGPSVTNTGINAGNKKLTGVEDGTIATNSKDAVNGSQLHQTNENVTNLTNNVTTLKNNVEQGLNFKGDNSTLINHKLGETVNVVGGADANKLSDNNIGVNANNGKLEVKLAKELNGLTNAKFNDNGKTTTIDGSGITIVSPTPGKTVSLTNNGLDNGGNKITNVAKGTNDTDAVNYSQLKDIVAGSVSTEIVEKKVADSGDENLADVSVADGKNPGDVNAKYQVSVSKKAVEKAAQGAIKVTGTSAINVNKTTDNGVDNYAVSFNGGEAAKSIPLTYKTNGNGAKTVTLDKGLDFVNGTMTTASIADNGVVKYDVNLSTIKVENGQAAVAGTPGANGANGTNGQDGVATVKNIVDAINSTAWNVTASKSTGEVSGNESKAVKNGDTVTYDAGKNIKITQNDKTFTFATKDDVSFTSVTTGDTKLSNDGVEITNGPKLTQAGVDAGSKKITNVADGDVGPNSKDAVNGSQLSAVDKKFNNKVSLGADSGSTTEKALSNNDGIKFNIKGGDSQKYVTTAATGDDITVDLTQDTKGKIDNAADKNLSNITDDGKKRITGLGTIVQAADGTITVSDSTDATTGQKTYSIKANIPTPEKTVMADGKNTTVEGDGSTANPFKVNVNDNLELGQKDVAGTSGKDASIKVNGKDGSAVTINGKDGSIGLNGANSASPVTIKTAQGPAGVNGANGETQDRLTVNSKAVATLEDGMKYGGDTGNVIKKQLNEQVNVIGGITDETKLTSQDNIGVVSDGSNNLKIKLAKDLNGIHSIKNGNTTMSFGDDKIAISGGNLDLGGNKITNVGAGEQDSDAANMGQLKEMTKRATTTVTSSDKSIKVVDLNEGKTGEPHKYDITVNNQSIVENAQIPLVYTKTDGTRIYKQADGTFNTQKDGSGETINAQDAIASINNGNNSTTNPMILNNIGSAINGKNGADSLAKLDEATKTTPNAAVNVSDLNNTAKALSGKGLKFGTQSAEEIHKNLGEKLEIIGEGTKADTEYSAENIKTVTKDGKVVVALDKDLKTETLTIGKDGKGGTIGINGKDGSKGSITVAQGKSGVDGKAGETKTRITYDITNPDGTTNTEQVATMNDGMKFVGNDGKEVIRKLNETLSITGGINDSAILTDDKQVSNANIGVRYKDQGGLDIVMKERPEFSGIVVNGKDGKDASVTFAKDGQAGMSIAGTRDANGKDALTIKGKNGKDGISFKDDGRISNVADGKDPNDAVNKSQLDKSIAQASSKVEAGKNITITPKVNSDGSTTYTVETKDDVEFTTVKAGDTTIDNNGMTINGGPSVTKDGINANDKKITGIKDGEISANSKDAVNGSQLHQTNQNVTNLANNVNKGLNFQGDNKEITVNRKLGDQLNIQGGADPKKLTKNNIGVTADKNGTMTVQLAKDVNLGTDGSLTAGNTTVNNNGVSIKGGPSMTNAGIDAGGKRVTNIARGNAPNDAVNMSQLQEVGNAINNKIDNIGNRITKIDKRRKAGNASALATAGLMQPHRDGQSALVAAVGQYQSETAVAVGYSRISDNGKYGVKVSFSTNSQGEVGGTAGAGYFW